MISGFLELDYLDLFMPCPQFGLNISPRENEIYAALGDDYNVGDISRDTIQGRGILVDLSLLLPRAVYFKNVSTTWENLGFLLHSLFHISITLRGPNRKSGHLSPSRVEAPTTPASWQCFVIVHKSQNAAQECATPSKATSTLSFFLAQICQAKSCYAYRCGRRVVDRLGVVSAGFPTTWGVPDPKYFLVRQSICLYIRRRTR